MVYHKRRMVRVLHEYSYTLIGRMKSEYGIVTLMIKR